MKGYKRWDLLARKVVISRDEILDERSMLESTLEEKKTKPTYCSNNNKDLI